MRDLNRNQSADNPVDADSAVRSGSRVDSKSSKSVGMSVAVLVYKEEARITMNKIQQHRIIEVCGGRYSPRVIRPACKAHGVNKEVEGELTRQGGIKSIAGDKVGV